MKVLIYGATGMVGQGVLRECLLESSVEIVQTVGRTPTGMQDPRLRELVIKDLFHPEVFESSLTGYDACFFCLGVSSAGMKEADYFHMTYDLTLANAKLLARLNPGMTFTYVSGAGTDSSEKGSSMWARVKGKTENDLLALPFKAAFMLRPGVIQPLHNIESKTDSYRMLYTLTKPLLPPLRWLFPNSVLTTEIMGRAMIHLAQRGYTKKILDPKDIALVAKG